MSLPISRRGLLAIGLIGFVGACLCLWLHGYLRELERQQAVHAFKQRTLILNSAIAQGLVGYYEVLEDLKAFVDTQDTLTRDNFRTFTHQVLDRHEEIQALEWVPRIRHKDRARMEAEAQSQGLPAYTIRQYTPDGVLGNAFDRDEYYPVYYAEPLLGNEAAIGFDLATSPKRLYALHLARDSAEAVASAPIRLVQLRESETAFLYFVAAYNTPATPPTSAQRRERLRGFVIGVFRVSSMIDSVLKDMNIKDVGIELFDVTDEDNILLYDNHQLTNTSFDTGVESSHELSIGGRFWRIRFVSDAQSVYHSESPYPTYILTLCLVVLIGCMIVVYREYNRANQTEAIVIQRTQELKASNQELDRARRHAELANESKSHFLANMSHELRTPLNSVILLSSIFAESDHRLDSRKRRKYGETIRESATHLLGLINQILDLAKVESGSLKLSLEPIDPNALLGEVVQRFEVMAQEKGLAYSSRSLLGSEVRLTTDASALVRILTNLIGNALKYTQEGSVSIAWGLSDTIDDPVSGAGDGLIVEVTDTGEGIPEEKQESIFNAFEQVDNSLTREHAGTGLGLALVARLLDNLGGRIRLKSTVGVGSVFSIWIPNHE